jgi:hypothetical protein
MRAENMRINALLPWSTIKNSAKNISDERAIDAFNNGLRRMDFIEELGRAQPRTVVVVVNKHMPWVGLSWGRCALEDLEERRWKNTNETQGLPRFRALVRR